MAGHPAPSSLGHKHMSHERAFESGASKHRRQRQQQQEDDENVCKIHKLDQFFVCQSLQQSPWSTSIVYYQ